MTIKKQNQITGQFVKGFFLFFVIILSFYFGTLSYKHINEKKISELPKKNEMILIK